MARGLFVSAVGTGQGKTWLTAELLQMYRERGIAADALKPVLSGFGPGSDAHLLLKALGRVDDSAALNDICRYRLEAPLSPDHAASREGMRLNLREIVRWTQGRMQTRPQAAWLVEGAGGIASPIAEDGLNAELAGQLGLPVLLVSRCYLGALSHILTAVRFSQGHGLRAALLLNAHDAEVETADMLDSLRRFLPGNVPLIGMFDSSGVSRECFTRLDELARGDRNVGSVQA